MANTPEAANSIKGLFQGLVPDPGGVVQGTVTGTSPLTIKVEGDDKLILNSSTLIISRHLTDHSIIVDISSGTENTSNGVTLTIYNSLKVGDKVHLLSFNAGKQYYVLDKVV